MIMLLKIFMTCWALLFPAIRGVTRGSGWFIPWLLTHRRFICFKFHIRPIFWNFITYFLHCAIDFFSVSLLLGQGICHSPLPCRKNYLRPTFHLFIIYTNLWFIYVNTYIPLWYFIINMRFENLLHLKIGEI